jgi:transcriptional regulator with XRE-family HTH domain
MDDWAHRENFKTHLTRYRKERGITLDQVALELGLTRNSLMGYLYKKDGARPGLDKLQKAAALFGCSVTEFLDDPGAPVPGVAPQGYGEASEEERVMLRAIAADLAGLTPDTRRAAFEAWSAIVRGFQAGGR